MSTSCLPLLLLTAALLGGSALVAQTAPAAGDLTLEECVRRALQKNFDLEAQQYTTQIAQEGINVAKDAYEPMLTASASRSGTTTGATATTSKVYF